MSSPRGAPPTRPPRPERGDLQPVPPKRLESPGVYAPAQIVRDAREHRVILRPVDVNASDWDCAPEPEPASAGGLALRLGLRLVAGLPEVEARAIVAARRARNGAPFGSVEEVAMRAGVDRRALEALAAADAFADAGAARRQAAWAARGVWRIGADGGGEFAFGAVRGGLDCRLGTASIHFTWEGSDEMDHACGDGDADLEEDGTLTGEIRFHRNDESSVTARRW